MNTNSRPVVYESAIDRWVVGMLLFSPLLSAIIGIYLFIEGKADGAMYLFLVGALATVITTAATLPCRYTILQDAISVRAGFLVQQISFADIVSVKPTSSWRSGPALSMRRVAIGTKNRIIIVSPRDREQFIADLSAAANLDLNHHDGSADT